MVHEETVSDLVAAIVNKLKYRFYMLAIELHHFDIRDFYGFFVFALILGTFIGIGTFGCWRLNQHMHYQKKLN